MEVTFDFSSVQKLSDAIRKYGRIMPTPRATAVLRKSARPMLSRAQSEAPVSMGGRMRISLRHRDKGNAANAYAQGGATRRDLRIKSVPPNGAELARVIVGVSQRRGKVGWRTPFILYGTKARKTKRGANRGRIQANNFLLRAYSATFPGVASDFQREFRVEFANWARTNFPQIGV